MVEIYARRDAMLSGTYQILRLRGGSRDPLRDLRPDEF